MGTGTNTSKFKIGDIIRAISSTGCYEVRKGTEHAVAQVSPLQLAGLSPGYIFHDGWFELVSSPNTMMQPVNICSISTTGFNWTFTDSFQSMLNAYAEPKDPLFKLPINNKKITMTKKLSNFITKTVDSKVQARLKAGLINGNLEPTEKGYDILREVLWFANIDAIDARAAEIVAEMEAEKCSGGVCSNQ